MRCVIISMTIGILGGYSERIIIFMSKYLRRDGGDNKKDHDILGIVLMIISAVLLVCCAIKVILGPISAAIQSFFLGVFGIFAYALLSFVFAAGLMLLLRRRISAPLGITLSVIGTVFFLFLLLQLCTSHSMLSLGIGDYLGEVYAAKWTAGGVVFGVIAYALRMMTIPAAYIITSLLLAACIVSLVYAVIRVRGLPSVFGKASEKEKRSRLPVNAAGDVRSDSETLAERVSRSNGVTSLFIENVVGDVPAAYDDGDGGELYDDDYSRLDLISKRHITQAQATNILYKSFSDEGEYDPILRSMKRPEERGDVAPGQGYYEQTERVRPSPAEPAAPDVHEATVDTRKKPDKIFHESDRAGNGFADLTLPTPKVRESDNDSGEIINGNAFLRDHVSRATFSGFTSENGYSSGGYVRGEAPEKTDGAQQTDATSDSFGERGNSGNIGFGVRASGTDSEASDSGIISADALNETHTEHIVQEKSSDSRGTYGTDRPAFGDFGGPAVGSFGVTGHNIADNDSPIASEEWFDNAGGAEETHEPERQRSFYEKESREEEQVFDSFSSAPPIITAENISDISAENTSAASQERIPAEPERQEGHAPAAESSPADGDTVADERNGYPEDDVLVTEEEVIDRSERSNFDGADHTGYYTHDADVSDFGHEPSSSRVNAPRTAEPEPVPEPQPEPEKPYIYTPPPIDLFDMPDEDNVVDPDEINEKTELIEETLADLRFPAKVCNVIVGPSVTRYELQPPQGIKVRNILSMDMDLELRLASGAIRIEAPVANKQVVGIEVANKHRVSVAFREIVDSPAFRDSKGVLPLALGKDIGGDAIVRNLEKMPHLLVAGATNMGKSVCLNTIIVSLIYRSSPEDVRIVLVDPKQIEFTLYRGLPHLLLENPITDVNHAVNALNYLIDEMERRFELFNGLSMQGCAVRNLEEYNKSEPVRSGKMKKMPSIVMVVDELADLMTTRKKDVEAGIRRIAQKARAAGIHLVLATQRPSVDIITGSIKVNLPSRISLKVTSNADSRTVLDQGGAEALIGKGDMLLMCNSEPIRLQGAFLTNEEIVSVVKYVKDHNEARFDRDIENAILVDQSEPEESAAVVSDAEESADEKMYPNIMRCFINMQKASTSLVQTRFALGYARASRIINIMEMRKWIGPSMGAKPREVYMTEAQFETIFGVPFNE